MFSLLFLGGLLGLSSRVDSVVNFADPNLEKAVREKINQPNAPITRLDVLAITELDASGREIRRLEGIETLNRLTVLNLANNAVEDLLPLADMGMLVELNLQNNRITDLDAINFDYIKRLPIRSLNLRDNFIENIESLSDFYVLEKLNLRGNRIRNVEPLTGLTGLVYLNIHSNPVIIGLDSLSNLQNLQTLIMRNVFIGENSQFLASLEKLQKLNIRNSSIADLSVLAALMQSGSLQDNVEAGVYAYVDLLESEMPDNGSDSYLSLRRYWDNISYTYPINLPYYPDSVGTPLFSHQSGFYTNGFYLTISTKESDEMIYYTLDGSDPSFNSQMEMMGTTKSYTEPIFIQDRTDLPNQLSSIVTDKWRQHIPSENVFKGTVVRAIVVDGAGNRSNALPQTYFVDTKKYMRYSFPVVSIVTDADNLFDDEIGIYTFGNLYQNIYPDEPWENPANFTQRGLKWERPASFEMFGVDGEMLLAQNIGLRIHGGYSRAFSPKSLRLVAGDEYDEADLIQYDFFPRLNNRLNEGRADSFKTLILRNGGNDIGRALFRDALAQSLLESTHLDIQGYQPVILFINGEYWGIHTIRTRYDEQYFQSYYGIEPDELVVFERGMDFVRLGSNTDDGNNFSNLFRLLDENYSQNSFATPSSLTDDRIYQQVAARVDIDNFISHFVAQTYFDNTDWPRTNVFTWAKTTNLSDSEAGISYGHDGRLRWMITDVDFGFINPEHNNLKRLIVELDNEPSTYILRALLENEEFKIAFINRFADYLNTIFHEDVVVGKVNEFEKLYLPEIEEHIQRWGVPGRSLASWRQNVDSIRNFALARPGYQRQHILEQFNLPGVVSVTLQADPTQGYIQINSIDIREGVVGVDNPANWSGIYFQGIPVTVTAVPAPGYRFASWQETGSTQETLPLLLTEDISLTAQFVTTE
jgi:Leucine-rich repeat (LRR) protein